MSAVLDIYLDTNAVLDLFPATKANLSADENRRRDFFGTHARHAIKDRVRAGQIRLTASGILFQELARHSKSDPKRYRRVIEYLRPLVLERIFLDTPLLIAGELQRGTSLSLRARFADKEHVRRMWSAVSAPAFLATVIEPARLEGEKYADQHRKLRESVMPQMNQVDRRPGESLHQSVMRWWTRDGRTFVRDMATPDLTSGQHTSASSVEQLPALWYSYSYRYARIILDIIEQRQIKASDYADPRHYVTGAYAATLVTDDTPLHDAHRLQPWSQVNPRRLKDFISDLD